MVKYSSYDPSLIMSIFTFSKNSFENQLPDEKIVLLTRKHWFVLFVPFLIISILTLVPLIIHPYFNQATLPLFWFLTSVYFLILWHLLFYSIMLYALNTVIITNKRIVENQQTGFFRHRVDELELHRIQDISIKVYGIIPELIGFGDLKIQTAGTRNEFIFTQLPNPKKIKSAIRRANGL